MIFFESGLLALSVLACAFAYWQLTDLKREKARERIATKLAGTFSSSLNKDHSLRRIRAPDERFLQDPELMPQKLNEYVEKLKEQQRFILEANRKFGRSLFATLFVSIGLLVLSSSAVLFMTEYLFGTKELHNAFQPVSTNFKQVWAGYAGTVYTASYSSQAGWIIYLASIVHQFCISTSITGFGLMPILLFRRPNMYGETLPRITRELKMYGGGDSDGLEKLKKFLLEKRPEEFIADDGQTYAPEAYGEYRNDG